MGIKERQIRDREAVRRSILDAARELFVSEGYERVSIRKIAERIEYSPAAIYGYFPSKDDLFFALAEEGFRLLNLVPAEKQAHFNALPSFERVRAGFWHLYEFSREHPQYFALIFLDRSVPRISREHGRFAFAQTGKQRVLEAVQQCIDERIFPGTLTAMGAFRVLQVAILGVALMRVSARLGAEEDADALASDALDVALAGLKSGVSIHTPSSSLSCVENAEPAEAEATS
jgi:AcrR family transcriptional regulator